MKEIRERMMWIDINIRESQVLKLHSRYNMFLLGLLYN